MKRINKLLALLMALVLLPAISLAEEGAAPVMPMRELTALEIAHEMGVGWNLGNTMDGHSGFTPSETCWQPTVTTQHLVDAVHDAGFNTMRLPVTWGTMIDDENGYAIDEAWLSRVQDIADYAVRQGMYVIINIHHDGAEQTGWLRIVYEGEQLEQVKAKFAAVWNQIALRFRDYDEHVIFEAMNEVCGDDPSPAGYLKDFRTIEVLNQIFVDTVRATGGNNTRRWLSVPPRYTNIINVLNEAHGFAMPKDSCVPAHLMLSVHDYDYSFGIQASMGATFWSQDKALALSKNIALLKERYVDKNIPVVLGEYGAVNKNNLGNRVYYYEAMNRMCAMNGIVTCAWDIGWYDAAQDPDYTFSLFDRGTGEKLYPEVITGILRGYYAPLSGNLRRNLLKMEHVETNAAPAIPGFDTVVFQEENITLASGEACRLMPATAPENRQDVVVYASSNPNVATVYNGLLLAKAPGTATITAKADVGEGAAAVQVTVSPAAVEKPVAEICIDADTYALENGEARQMNVTLQPADHTDAVYFTSSDESVVTVNSLGKLVGIGGGTAEITVATASGLTKTVSVTVGGEPAPAGDPLTIGIGIYYNDPVHNHYTTETGETLAISGNGTYTLTFNARAHMSAKGQGAGVNSLTGVGAIYLYDVDGRARVLESCDIHYDEILLDGKPVTLNEHTPKTALKKNGKFDTNDPLNAWDGSVSPDVSVEGDHVLVFEGDETHRQITITFTLSNWKYAE